MNQRGDNLAVIRVEKNSNYTVMANYHLRDDLSLKAKGLMSMMLSLPDNWDYSVVGLTSISKESANTINKCLQELEEKGYLVRERKKEKSSGKFKEVEYTLYEKPYLNFPHMDLPHMDLPYMENCAQLNTNTIKERNSKNTNKRKRVTHTYGEFKKVKLTDDEFNTLKEEYPNSHMNIIQYLDEYKEMYGKTYKNDYLAIKKWVIQACKEKCLINDLPKKVEPKSVQRKMEKVNDDFNDF